MGLVTVFGSTLLSYSSCAFLPLASPLPKSFLTLPLALLEQALVPRVLSQEVCLWKVSSEAIDISAPSYQIDSLPLQVNQLG